MTAARSWASKPTPLSHLLFNASALWLMRAVAHSALPPISAVINSTTAKAALS
jgi:hypothetical protein